LRRLLDVADAVLAMTSSVTLVTCVYVICVVMTSLAAVGEVESPPSPSPSPSPPPDLSSFDRLVRQLMGCRQVPGLVVAVVDMRRRQNTGAGDVDPAVVLRHYGLADVERGRPMTNNTRVCIASLTKAFTSTLLGIMLRNATTRPVTLGVFYLRQGLRFTCVCLLQDYSQNY